MPQDRGCRADLLSLQLDTRAVSRRARLTSIPDPPSGAPECPILLALFAREADHVRHVYLYPMIEALQEMTAPLRLRERLEANGISQTGFAKTAEPSLATVNRLCTKATSRVSLESLDKIASTLQTAGDGNAAGEEVGADDIIAVERETKKRGSG